MNARDEILLQDLLDDRLDEAAATALRARIASERNLQDAWDDVTRMRDVVRGDSGVRAPRDFLSRVRERIALLPDDAQEKPDDQPGPALRTHPRWRWSTALSAAAALLLVALGARLAFLGSDAPEGRVHESARARSAWDEEDAEADALSELDKLEMREPGFVTEAEETERADRFGPEACRPVEEGVPPQPAAPPAPTSGPVPPPTSPSGPVVGRSGGFGPGDAVPPGLRTPSDEPPEQARRRDAKSGLGLGGSVAGSGALKEARERQRVAEPKPGAVYVLEARVFAEGRAKLALLVDALQSGDELELLERRSSRLEGRPDSGTEDQAAGERTVLGTVVLDLTRAEATRLLAGQGTDEGHAQSGPKRNLRVHVQIVRSR